MPTRAPRSCERGGCHGLTVTGSIYCQQHRDESRRLAAERDAQRPNAHARGYDAKWERLRDLKLATDPLCELELREGKTVAATQVDHIKPHRGNKALMFDWSNLQSLCASCHSRKTATQDSSFARRGKRNRG